MTKIRLIIAGSRTVDPTDEQITEAVLEIVLNAFRFEDSDPDVVARVRASLADYIEEVICGKADGADAAGERWAKARGIPVHPEPITSEDMKLGKYLGPRARNRRMAIRGTHALIWWDGVSGGSADMCIRMNARRKPVTTIPIHKRPPKRPRQRHAP